MAIVPLERLRVEANFKEVQLTRMRIGQPVTVVADLYGGQVEYHGTVPGVGLGTGAAFALLPAQNATGNWIKVVQRVPVRIALEPAGAAGAPAAHRTLDARQRRRSRDDSGPAAGAERAAAAGAHHRRLRHGQRRDQGAHRADHPRELDRGRGTGELARELTRA